MAKASNYSDVAGVRRKKTPYRPHRPHWATVWSFIQDH